MASHDGEKYYGGLRARYPEGDLRVPWERYSATPVAMPDYGGDFQPYYSRESVRRQIAVFEHEADDVKIASDGLSLDDLSDNIGFAVHWKKSGTWGGFTYTELNPLAKYLYRRALGYGNDRALNINLRRCHWGNDECRNCLECVADIKENDVIPHTDEELDRRKPSYSDEDEQEQRKYSVLRTEQTKTHGSKLLESINDYKEKVTDMAASTRAVHCKREKYDIYIGRRCGKFPQSKWGNPYKIGKDCTREQAIERYRQDLLDNPELLKDIPELRGKVLGCWCKPEPCHGDVLAELSKLSDDEFAELLRNAKRE